MPTSRQKSLPSAASVNEIIAELKALAIIYWARDFSEAHFAVLVAAFVEDLYGITQEEMHEVCRRYRQNPGKEFRFFPTGSGPLLAIRDEIRRPKPIARERFRPAIEGPIQPPPRHPGIGIISDPKIVEAPGIWSDKYPQRISLTRAIQDLRATMVPLVGHDPQNNALTGEK